MHDRFGQPAVIVVGPGAVPSCRWSPRTATERDSLGVPAESGHYLLDVLLAWPSLGDRGQEFADPALSIEPFG